MWSSTYYGHWALWELYHKCTFDGANRIIYVNYGETSVDVEQDIYSDWKEWMRVEENSRFPYAFTAIGGEPIGGGQFVGSTFFLENGWRIKPWEGNHSLEVVGNLYTREQGESPYLTTDGQWKINITNRVSALVFDISSQASTGSAANANEIASAVWKYSVTGSMPTDTYGDHVYRKLLTLAQYMATK